MSLQTRPGCEDNILRVVFHGINFSYILLLAAMVETTEQRVHDRPRTVPTWRCHSRL